MSIHAPDYRAADRIVERREALPADPPPGHYVVVDVLNFSTTVVELLAGGAKHVHVPDARGDQVAYKRANPTARIGGEDAPDDEPTAAYDFVNSPSDVQGVDVDGRPVSLTSINGGRTVSALRNADEAVDVYVGSTTNAAAVARYLRGQEGPIYLVGAGSSGDVAGEDLIGAALIDRYLDDVPLGRTELDRLREGVRMAKQRRYGDSDAIPPSDVREYAMNFDSRTIVPKLVGDALVDVSRTGESAVARRQAAD
jgi:2-phosphosulfolactate phosphatase